MSKPKYTHVMNYGGKDIGQQMATLYRADGMLLAGIAGRTVNFGADPRLPDGQRLFLTTDQALGFLRRIAHADLNGHFHSPRIDKSTVQPWELMPREQFANYAEIEERDKDRLIAFPGEDLPIPVLKN